MSVVLPHPGEPVINIWLDVSNWLIHSSQTDSCPTKEVIIVDSLKDFRLPV